nr:MAG TPA: hypothetical protein [Caudoviricetes sp.]
MIVFLYFIRGCGVISSIVFLLRFLDSILVYKSGIHCIKWFIIKILV